jgi:predicted AlkP superfamily pyrophosphatase or phosphodiesterase
MLTVVGLLAAQNQAVNDNDASQAEKPYVVLISIDGFRSDYAEREQAKNLLAFRDAGSSAASLLPVYPSTTFPNQMSIVTGMYPARHGIVENMFFDPVRNATYLHKNSTFNTDGTWYLAPPLWTVAEAQGMRSASLFWQGSEAEIQRHRPAYWLPYNAALPDDKRVEQIISWLKLPAEKRPHLITAYFSEVDVTAHAKGTRSLELSAAIQSVDAAIGSLMAQLKQLQLPVNVIVVSDHGMQDVLPEPIDITKYADLSKFKIIGSGGQVMLYSEDEALIQVTLAKLRGANDPRILVYRRSEAPERFRYRQSRRVGDIIVVAQTPQLIRARVPLPGANSVAPQPATHGFDPAKFPSMQGIFYAQGPHIKPGIRLESFENVHVYPLIAKILGLLVPPEMDGQFSVLEPIYRR